MFGYGPVSAPCSDQDIGHGFHLGSGVTILDGGDLGVFIPLIGFFTEE